MVSPRKGMAPSITKADLGPGAALQVTAEAGWDLDRQGQPTAGEPPLPVGIVDQRGLLGEPGGTGELLQVVAARRGAVAIEHGIGDIIHIEGDAEAHGDHQQQRPEEGKGEADRVAAQLGALAPGIGPEPARGEATGLIGAAAGAAPGPDGGGALDSKAVGLALLSPAAAGIALPWRWWLLRRLHRSLLHIGDEGVLQSSPHP